MQALRWIAVLPAALLAGALAAFPLHFILYLSLTNSGIVEPYPETPERVLRPLVAAVAFIWAGRRVAPRHKFETAAILFGIYLAGIGAAVALEWSHADIGGKRLTSYGGMVPVAAFVGALIGLLSARRRASDTPNEAERPPSAQ